MGSQNGFDNHRHAALLVFIGEEGGAHGLPAMTSGAGIKALGEVLGANPPPNPWHLPWHCPAPRSSSQRYPSPEKKGGRRGETRSADGASWSPPHRRSQDSRSMALRLRAGGRIGTCVLAVTWLVCYGGSAPVTSLISQQLPSHWPKTASQRYTCHESMRASWSDSTSHRV